MDFENLILEYHDHIALLKINRPKALNALNGETLKELSQAFALIADDTNIRVVLLTGSGEKAFVAGADIAQMSSMNSQQARRFSQLGHNVMNQIENLPQPVIAAVNGFALGGGTELAMSCDLRLASEKAKFGQPEVTLGLLAGFGGTQRLARLVGGGRASEILFTGDMIDAQEAYRIGLVNRVYSQDELMNEAMKLAQKISSRAPLGVQLSKTAIQRGQNMDIVTGQDYEAEVFGQLFSTQDQKEGCSAFLEKRQAIFQGH
ncbi:enoyl-CoA hydratase-related protein [Desulfitobacterium sp.]|uniref:enoyl-CoA hydratase-related protein n=1 Tax=Desulfitobacterium sp. TaxID=49981 RepID=UPI002B1F5ABC|nr:enoyl-CoA hydratase-related protein [Desulfitobacterium sp.]MEA4902078.1 enoyl-CoA hydratase-related protein [Desulfitobacterium sp.]